MIMSNHQSLTCGVLVGEQGGLAGVRVIMSKWRHTLTESSAAGYMDALTPWTA